MSARGLQDEVQEFAALLRRLKERTDRSYGSLARRLNMNTSTLHRYCAGDAVPVDFAPAERFAALCGASAEERLDLHRLWLAAVAARQRPRAGEAADAAAGTAAATATEAAVVGVSGAGATDEATVTADLAPAADDGTSATADKVNAATAPAGCGAVVDSAAGVGTGGEVNAATDSHAMAGGAGNGSVTGAATDDNATGELTTATDSHAMAGGAGNGSVTGAAADDDATGELTTATDSHATADSPANGSVAGAAGDVSVARDVGVGGDVSASAEGEGDALLAGRGADPTRPWYRRRRVVMTAAAAVALLATLGSLSALPSGRSASDEVAQAPDPSSRTTATASGSPRHSPSKSPSPSATSGSPSPKGTRNSPSASATDGGAATKGTGKSGQQGAATGTPLTWTVNSHVWNAGCGHDYVIDKPPAQVPPPPTAQDAANWAGTLGAIHGRQTMVQISVQGRSSTAVVLEDLRVRVVSRGTPAKGNSYAVDQGCGGALTPRYFSVDLDKDRPIAHSQSGNDGENVIPAVRMPYRVSSEDPEVLLVTAETEGCDCSWYLELDWSSQGRTGTVRVDDDGRPFRTSAIKGLPRYWYGTNTAGERAWVDYDS
ncbi:helix-turn-helix domain-containing protein [Streptomyces canus]|uniref:helix-turn-helix domain-containing protein n=1 Tax=Streptomyces canus TaxID=58343 RepID=UPI0007497ADB|nr:helix-turn-helix domain-containing protein [Streptomyces canus]KUN15303.1 DNA-binding protein [Streptomyces canus]